MSYTVCPISLVHFNREYTMKWTRLLELFVATIFLPELITNKLKKTRGKTKTKKIDKNYNKKINNEKNTFFFIKIYSLNHNKPQILTVYDQ